MAAMGSAQGTWIEIPRTTTRTLRTLHFVDHLNGWAAGDSGVIIRTQNGGLTWQVQQSGISTMIVDIFFHDVNFGWGVSHVLTPPFHTVVLRTTDGGLTWLSAPYPAEDKFMNAIHFRTPTRGWMGGYGETLLETTDGGIQWRPPANSGLCSNLPLQGFAFRNDQIGFASGGFFDLSGTIWSTTNGGLDWTSICISPEPLNSLVILDSLTVVGVGGDYDFGSGVVRTRNGGLEWDYTNLEIFGIARALSFRTSTEGWATLGEAQKFIRTFDRGITWTELSTPGNTPVHDLTFVNSGRGFAVGGGGAVFTFDTTTVHADENSNETLSSLLLLQNYPNPFNPVTSIRYRLFRESHVRMVVLDPLGRLIETLVDDKREAGDHLVQFDGSGRGSGVYFYRLIAGPLQETGSMILLR